MYPQKKKAILTLLASYKKSRATKKRHRCFLRSLNNTNLDHVCECIYNIVYFPDVTPKKRKQLKRLLKDDEKVLRLLANKHLKRETKLKHLRALSHKKLARIFDVGIYMLKKNNKSI